MDRSNAHIFSKQDVIDFLDKIGPDTSINAFSCNFKQKGDDGKWHRNKNVDRFNDYNKCIFHLSSHARTRKDDTKRMIKRIPLILTKSEKDCESFGQSLDFMRLSLGLENTKPEQKLTLLINSVMNPIQTSEGHVSSIQKSFRETSIICAEKMNKNEVIHSFLIIGKVSKSGEFFGENIMPNKHSAETKDTNRIQAILLFRLVNTKQSFTMNEKLDEGVPIIFSIWSENSKGERGVLGIYDIAFGKEEKRVASFDVYNGFPAAPSSPFLTNVEISSKEVLYYQSAQNFWKAGKKVETIPEKHNILQYFLFGTETQSFMTKIRNGYLPELRHVVELKHHLTTPPLDEKLIRFGLEVKVIHPKNVLINKKNWEDPSYTPLIVEDQEGGMICSNSKNASRLNKDSYLDKSCLASIRAADQDEMKHYLIEFPRPFGKSRVPTESPYIVSVYEERDIFYDIE